MPKLFTPIEDTGTAFGCLSLMTGVQLVCLVSLLECIVTLALVDSFESNKDVIEGAYALVGIALTIIGGVAVLYSIETALRGFLYFLFFGFVMRLLFHFGFHPYDWPATFLYCAVSLYCLFVVWSACEDIADAGYPELMTNSHALKYSYSPDVRIKEEDARPAEKVVGQPTMNIPFVPVPSTRQMWLNNPGWRGGTPQSFMPMPGSGFVTMP